MPKLGPKRWCPPACMNSSFACPAVAPSPSAMHTTVSVNRSIPGRANTTHAPRPVYQPLPVRVDRSFVSIFPYIFQHKGKIFQKRPPLIRSSLHSPVTHCHTRVLWDSACATTTHYRLLADIAVRTFRYVLTH